MLFRALSADPSAKERPPALTGGQISNSAVQSHLQKYFRFRIAQITSTSAAVLSPRGALAIVTNAGQDAMDADVPLTNGMNADGEVVWF